MDITAIDVGYGYTKIKTSKVSNGFLPSEIIMPSAVGHGRKRYITNNEVLLNSIDVDYNNKNYFIGNLAINESIDVSLAFEENKINHQNTILLILMGTVLANYESCNDKINYIKTNLVTGLPIYYLDQKQNFKETFKNKEYSIKWGNKTYRIQFKDILIIPQGAGALFYEILDDKGNVKHEEFLSRKIGLVDVGFKTTDFITLNCMKYIDKESGTIEIGINHALKMANTEKLLHELEFHNNSELTEAKNSICNAIADNLFSKIPNLNDYFAYYIAGGGSKYIKNRIPNAISIPHPQMANVLGYYKIGQVKLNAINNSANN